MEQGTHNDLVERPAGAYATLLKMQLTAQRREQDNLAGISPDALDDNDVIVPPEQVQHGAEACWSRDTACIARLCS